MRSIDITQFQQALKQDGQNPEVAFIDVRTPEEYAAGHIEGVTNIPLDELSKRAEELRDKKTVYVQCLSGGRSARAIEWFEFIGHAADFVNVSGGFMAWQSAGFPTV